MFVRRNITIFRAAENEGGSASASPASKSLDDIAASMLDLAPAPADDKAGAEDKKKKRPDAAADSADRAGAGSSTGGNEADEPPPADDTDDNTLSSEDGEEDTSSTKTEDDNAEDDVLGGDLFSEDDADEDRDGEGESDALDTSKLGDDVELSVTVDGEEKKVTLGELKRRYAGEGAIEKRLQVATETRNQAVTDYTKMQQLSATVLEKFGQFLFRRTVEPPPEALLTQNPTEYIRRKELYEKEGAALQRAHSELYSLMSQVDQEHQRNRQAQRQAAAQRLREIMPVFNDPVKGPKVKDALVQAAKKIGYTEADIAACEDPLMFKTMALAARELRRMEGMKVEKVKEKVRTTRQQAQNRPAKAVQKRQEAAAMQRAKKTGSLDDIAATMLAPAPKQNRR